jgi:hypothetical protein
MATETNRDKAVNRVLKFFNLAVIKKDQGQKEVHPGIKQKTKGGNEKFLPIQFPSDVQKAYNWFLNSYFNYDTNLARLDRYEKCEFMVYNNGIMSSAASIYADETYEVKNGDRAIQIMAKSDVSKFFYEWLDAIGFNTNVLREVSYNLTIYGDSFLSNSITMDEGVKGITLLDPYLVVDRLEFNLGHTAKMAKWGKNVSNTTHKDPAIKRIADIITNELSKDSENFGDYFKSYTLGFVIKIGQEGEEKALPPWAITHFRRESSQSEFFPFGKPLLIYSLAPYMSYESTKLLIDMARAASFPKEIYKITLEGDYSRGAIYNKINLVREMIQNISTATKNKDDLSIGEPIFTVEGLYEYNVEDSKIDLGDLYDLENKQEELILSTNIPDTILNPSKGAGELGGDSAIAMMYNNKLFQRRLDGNRTAILEGLTELFRLHLEIIQKFDGAETEFELFIPVNSEAFSKDKISQEQDLMRLASDMIEKLGGVLGINTRDGEALPLELVKQIFDYYLPIDSDIMSRWFKMGGKAQDEKEKEEAENPTPPEPENTGFNPYQKKKKFESKMSKFKLTEGAVVAQYFESKRSLGLLEGIHGGKLYYNNSYRIKKEKLNTWDLFNYTNRKPSLKD